MGIPHKSINKLSEDLSKSTDNEDNIATIICIAVGFVIFGIIAWLIDKFL